MWKQEIKIKRLQNQEIDNEQGEFTKQPIPYQVIKERRIP